MKIDLDNLKTKLPVSYDVIDSHTCGASARLLIDGLSLFRGSSLRECLECYYSEFEGIRLALMQEPRGHESSFGAVLLPPFTPEEDMSCLFMHNDGYVSMCGHVSLAIGNLIRVFRQSTANNDASVGLKLRTLAGVVSLSWDNSEMTPNLINYLNVPSFLYGESEVTLPGVGSFSVAISFGGNFYILVNIDNIFHDTKQLSISKITKIGEAILNAVNLQHDIVHPLDNTLDAASLVMFYKLPISLKDNIKVFTTWGFNKFDRSPCGTGSAALLAYLYSLDRIDVGEHIRVESILGSIFYAQLIREVSVGAYLGVIPKISGESYITGLSQLVIEPRDSLGSGFSTPAGVILDW